MVDLSDLITDIEAQDAGKVFHLVDPVSGRTLDWWFRIAGPDSTIRREADFWYARSRSRLSYAGHTLTPEELDGLAIGQLARVVVDMGGVEEAGEAVAFSVENVERLFRLIPWARAQVDLYASSRNVYVKEAADA